MAVSSITITNLLIASNQPALECCSACHQFVIAVAGNGDKPELYRVLILVMARTCTRKMPLVLLQQANEFTDLRKREDMSRHPASQCEAQKTTQDCGRGNSQGATLQNQKGRDSSRPWFLLKTVNCRLSASADLKVGATPLTTELSSHAHLRFQI